MFTFLLLLCNNCIKLFFEINFDFIDYFKYNLFEINYSVVFIFEHNF